MGRASHGINPCTFRGTQSRTDTTKMALTIARMHISMGGPVMKWMPIVIWNDEGDAEEKREPIAQMILDEDHFLEGMYHLFPIEGSMDHADRVPASVNEELVTLLRGALNELRRLGAEGSAEPLETLLAKYGL